MMLRYGSTVADEGNMSAHNFFVQLIGSKVSFAVTYDLVWFYLRLSL
jgi:hypothetical protein